MRYQYEQRDDQQQLVVDVREKSWGPNYVNFRFFLEDDFDTESQYALGVSTNFTDINSHGAELALNMDMGTDKLIEAELYSPLLSGQKHLRRHCCISVTSGEMRLWQALMTPLSRLRRITYPSLIPNGLPNWRSAIKSSYGEK